MAIGLKLQKKSQHISSKNSCRCDHSVRHLCTPLCHAHMKIPSGTIVGVSYDVNTMNLKFIVNNKTFTRCLMPPDDDDEGLGEGATKQRQRLHPAVSVRSAKVRIFNSDADVFD